MNQGYVSTAAPSPAAHVKAGAANMSGSVWVVGTGWRHRFLSHCAMLRHLVTLATCRGPPRCSPARGHRTLFFRRGPVRCQPSGLLLRAAPRRCSERGRGGCTLRVLGGSTAAAPPRGAACSLACSTGHNEMLQSARPSIAPTRTAYIRTKYLYTSVSISI